MNNNVAMIIGIGIIAIAIIIFVIVLYTKMKKIKVSAIYFISGAVKTGKSGLMVWLGLREYIKTRVRFFIRKCMIKEFQYITFHKSKRINQAYAKLRKPILITNMPLRFIKWYPFTYDILLRKVRIPNCSVILLDETSLVADSMNYKNKNLNNQLLVFYKLFGHYSHGGKLICNSQSWSDNHYSLKRCMSRYTYIYESIKLPFISWFKVREMFYSEDNTSVNMSTTDIEKTGMTNIFIPNFIFKLYDRFYLSAFTDDLAYYDKSFKQLKLFDSLKVKELVSLQDFANDLNKEIKEYEKE